MRCAFILVVGDEMVDNILHCGDGLRELENGLGSGVGGWKNCGLD